MMMDLIRELGPMAFASRLKRLSDRLKSDVTQLYIKEGVDFNAGWFLVGYILARHDSLSISEIADALGISRPAVSQITSIMARHKLISVRRDAKDGRYRCVSLTKKGRKTVAELEPIWEAVRECTRELLEATDKNALAAIDDIESSLDQRSMFDRVQEYMSRVK